MGPHTQATFSMSTRNDVQSDMTNQSQARFNTTTRFEGDTQLSESKELDVSLNQMMGTIVNDSIAQDEMEEGTENDTIAGASDESDDDNEEVNELLRELIETQDRLHERDKEILGKENELDGMRQLVSSLTSTLARERVASENEGLDKLQKIFGNPGPHVYDDVGSVQHTTVDLGKQIQALKVETEQKNSLLRDKQCAISNMINERAALEHAIEDLEEKAQKSEYESQREIALLTQGLVDAQERIKKEISTSKCGIEESVMLELLSEKQQEICSKEKGLERLREKNNDLKARLDLQGIAHKDEELKRLQGLIDGLTSDQEEKATEMQQTIETLTEHVEEKDRDLQARKLNLTSLVKEKTQLEADLQELDQGTKKQQGNILKEMETLKVRLSDSEESERELTGKLELATEQTSEVLHKDIAHLRSLVAFFKLNSENVAIKNDGLMVENRRLRSELGNTA